MTPEAPPNTTPREDLRDVTQLHFINHAMKEHTKVAPDIGCKTNAHAASFDLAMHAINGIVQISEREKGLHLVQAECASAISAVARAFCEVAAEFAKAGKS